MAPAESGVPRTVRCAVYTRKSTEEGLSQDFNSLDAQRECAEAYILSQRQEGWTLVSQRYDDGGFTGANLERPALRQLTADIEARQVRLRTCLQSRPAQPIVTRLRPADGGFRQARGDVCIGHS